MSEYLKDSVPGRGQTPRLEIHQNSVISHWGGAHAEVPIDEIIIAHMGCRLLGSVSKEISVETRKTWDIDFGKAWKKTTDSKGKLAAGLERAVRSVKLGGLVLWDTMYNGSDYWRPGNLVRQVVELLPSEIQMKTSYQRVDFFCPPGTVLNRFRNEVDFSFGRYAQEYRGHLTEGGYAYDAAAEAVFNLSRQQLPVFYCTDPYVPGFSDRLAVAPQDLRDLGCHRVVLVQEIVNVFLKLGMPEVTLVEIDQTFDATHIRKLRQATPT